MMRFWGRLLALLVLLGAVLVPALFWGAQQDSSSYEPTTIKSYDADFVLDDDGSLQVTEKLAVSFPGSGQHGIFRFFDLQDAANDRAVRQPQDFTATRDGAAEEIQRSTQGVGRYVTYRLGSAGTFLTPGVHDYEMRYRIDNVVNAVTQGARGEFFWRLIPNGWRQPIEAATVHVSLPVDSAADLDCSVGFDDANRCTITGAGTRNLTITASNLAPNTPITLRTGLDVPPSPDSIAWPVRFLHVFGSSTPVAMIVGLLGLVALFLGNRLGRSTREPKPPFPLQYAPPEGIGPAQAQYILTESIGREQYVASLLHAAEHGAAGLDQQDKTWSISGKGDWAPLDEVTQTVGTSLGITSGGTFQASRGSKTDGQLLQQSIKSFEGAVKVWSRSSGNVATSGLGSLGGLLVVASAVIAGVLVVVGFNQFFTLLALIPGLFAVGALEFLERGSTTRRTAQGRELWSKLGGFKRVLSTSSAEARFDFAAHKDLYTAFIPWAVAFGVADEWAKKYRTETGQEPPVPSYFPVYAGAHTGNYVNSMVGDFNATVNSAISSYNASQSSSSGGGGGFSGGGGGGGGGGSW